MPVSFFSSITSLLLIFPHLALVSGYDSYEFGEDCTAFSNYLDEESEMHVGYDGKQVDLFCDYFKFRGRGVDILDEYSVCVTPIYFNDNDCAVEINIKTSILGVTKHKITCTKNKSAKYCGPQDETLYIEFKNRDGRNTDRANFKLKITAKKEYDYGDHSGPVIGAIIGGVIGGLVLITVCIAIFCYCVCRRKPAQGRIFNPTVGYPATGNQYVVYTAQTQPNTMAMPSNISTPGVYPMAPYPPPGGVANPQTTENKLANAPPSYDTLTEPANSHVYDTIQ